MPYSIRVSQARINPGTTPNYQCQTPAWSRQLLMSARTQARKLSMPNQAQFVIYQCQHGHKLVKYQCQTWARSCHLSMSTRTQARKLSMPNMGTIILSYQCQHGHKLINYQCQTRAQSPQLSMSTRTQTHKQSMPNTGTISSAINVNTDTSS